MREKRENGGGKKEKSKNELEIASQLFIVG
jgi:hypothetical protein